MVNAATETGKPLAVLGAPAGRAMSKMLGGDHECADLCIDPKGCEGCDNVMVAEYADALTQMAAGSHVLYVDTGVFERAQFPDDFASELQRVSGGDLFMAPLGQWSLFAYLPPNKQRVSSAPPAQAQLAWRGWRAESAGQLSLAGHAPNLYAIQGGRI